MVEFEADAQQQLALEQAAGGARVADGAEEDDVVAAQLLEDGIRERFTGGVPPTGSEVVLGSLDVTVRHGVEHLQPFGHHLGADSVTCNDCQIDRAHTSRVANVLQCETQISQYEQTGREWCLAKRRTAPPSPPAHLC